MVCMSDKAGVGRISGNAGVLPERKVIFLCTQAFLFLGLTPGNLQAVDVVGQAGKPKTITGFQTHTTPVLLAHGERAELATEECILSLAHPTVIGR